MGLFGGLKEAFGSHPFARDLGPAVDRELGLACPEPVAALGVHVEFRLDVLALVFEVEAGGFDRVRVVVVRDHEEARRGVGRHAEAFAELGLVLLLEEAAAVDEDREVRATRVVDAGLLFVGARRAVPGRVADEIGAGGEADQDGLLQIQLVNEGGEVIQGRRI